MRQIETTQHERLTVLYVPSLLDSGYLMRSLQACRGPALSLQRGVCTFVTKGGNHRVSLQISAEDSVSGRTTRAVRSLSRKSSISIILICTTSRRIPASASTKRRPEKGDLTPLWEAKEGPAEEEAESREPPESAPPGGTLLKRFSAQTLRWWIRTIHTHTPVF